MNKTLNLALWGLILLTLIIAACKKQSPDFVTASDGVKISIDVQGSGEPALLFIPGWTNDKSIWKDQVTHFSEKYRVVSIDLPAHGKSGDDREDFTLPGYGEDVATVIRELDLDQVVLVGFSMGGAVAIEAANQVPENITGVVLVDNLQDPEMGYPPAVIPVLDSMMMDLVTNPSNEKLLAMGFYTQNPESSFARVQAFLEGGPRAGWHSALQNTIRWQNEHCLEALQEVQVPILAINSEQRPTQVDVFRKYVPEFHARIIPGTGHLVMWDAPEEFNRSLEESIQQLQGMAQ